MALKMSTRLADREHCKCGGYLYIGLSMKVGYVDPLCMRARIGSIADAALTHRDISP